MNYGGDELSGGRVVGARNYRGKFKHSDRDGIFWE
jgi:hypothetical protein